MATRHKDHARIDVLGSMPITNHSKKDCDTCFHENADTQCKHDDEGDDTFYEEMYLTGKCWKRKTYKRKGKK